MGRLFGYIGNVDSFVRKSYFRRQEAIRNKKKKDTKEKIKNLENLFKKP